MRWDYGLVPGEGYIMRTLVDGDTKDTRLVAMGPEVYMSCGLATSTRRATQHARRETAQRLQRSSLGGVVQRPELRR